MGLISKLGRWLDTRFPEKISAEEVYRSLTAYTGMDVKISMNERQLEILEQKLISFQTGAQSFDKELHTLKDKLTTLETVMKMRPQPAPVMTGKEAWKR